MTPISQADLRTLEIATGMPVTAYGILQDKDTLIYLDMIGPKARVRATWAALKANNRRTNIFYEPITVRKEEHVLIKRTLPNSQWENWIMLHRQLSHQAVRPDNFYLINPRHEPCNPDIVPANFHAMLSKVCPLPILPAWSIYLWKQAGRYNLLQSITNNCHALTGWKVLYNPEKWARIITKGLQEGALTF